MLKILVIDDEKSIRDSFRHFLEDYDYQVIEAANGLEGLEVFRREAPDLVLVDLNMPEMNGWELAEKLKEMYPHIAVLYTSGYTDDLIIQNGALQEGIHFIQKPFSFQTLAEKVRKVLDSSAGTGD